MARLKSLFIKEIVPTMMKEFQYKNPWQVPRLEKIIINQGLGEATMVCTASAIANAIYNAVGVRVKELPITQEKVLGGLRSGV